MRYIPFESQSFEIVPKALEMKLKFPSKNLSLEFAAICQQFEEFYLNCWKVVSIGQCSYSRFKRFYLRLRVAKIILQPCILVLNLRVLGVYREQQHRFGPIPDCTLACFSVQS